MDRERAAGADTSRAAHLARFRATYRELERRLVAEPRVAGVTVAERFPRMYHPARLVEVDGGGAAALDADDAAYRVSSAAVDVDYFDVLGAPVRPGRPFRVAEAESGARVAIVNRSFVHRVLGGRNPLGRRVRYLHHEESEKPYSPHDAPGPWYEIVGVVGDMGMSGARDPKVAGLYHPLAPAAVAEPMHMAIHVRGDPQAFAPRLRAVAAAVDPALRLDAIVPAAELSQPNLQFLDFWFRLTLLVSVIAVVLSLAGIYAVMSFTVARRTREIGIRVALGASAPRVIASVFARPLTQVGVGVAVGGMLAGLLLVGMTGGTPSVTGARAARGVRSADAGRLPARVHRADAAGAARPTDAGAPRRRLDVPDDGGGVHAGRKRPAKHPRACCRDPGERGSAVRRGSQCACTSRLARWRRVLPVASPADPKRRARTCPRTCTRTSTRTRTASSSSSAVCCWQRRPPRSRPARRCARAAGPRRPRPARPIAARPNGAMSSASRATTSTASSMATPRAWRARCTPTSPSALPCPRPPDEPLALRRMTKEELVELTRAGALKTPRDRWDRSVRVLDVAGNAAVARVGDALVRRLLPPRPLERPLGHRERALVSEAAAGGESAGGSAGARASAGRRRPVAGPIVSAAAPTPAGPCSAGPRLMRTPEAGRRPRAGAP
jgi:hypothetical protein